MENEKLTKITCDFDGQEFMLVNPVITDTISEYDEEQRCKRTETNVNATLVGGNEEKRVSEFFYDDKGFRTVSKASNEDKETESIVTHDDQGRILKIETPISITEYNYVSDEEFFVTTKDIVGETCSEEHYKKIDGKDRQVGQVVKRATGELLSMITRNYVLDKDKIVIKVMEKGIPFDTNIVTIYKYSTDQLLFTNNGSIGPYHEATLKYTYDDKNRLEKIEVCGDDDEIKDTIEYKIEEIDEHTSISRSKYESILTTEDENLKYMDMVMFKPFPEYDQDVSNQHIRLGEHHQADISINIAINDKHEFGKAERFYCTGPDDLQVDIMTIFDTEGNIEVDSYELGFKLSNKQYYINTDFNRFLTKVEVTTYNEFGSEESTKDLTFRTVDNEDDMLKYILSKFKEYIKGDENLQQIIDMSKIKLPLDI